MTRAYYGDRFAWIACRTCERTPIDFLRKPANVCTCQHDAPEVRGHDGDCPMWSALDTLSPRYLGEKS